MSVYDLTVEGEPEFFANGVLVHNCPACEDMQGVVLKIEEARGMLPRHPGCRCSWTASGVGESDEGQTKSQRGIESAIRASVGRDGGPDKSRWVGADAKIAKARPESILDNALVEFSRFITNAGDNCGIGPGGFEPGNTCAKGGAGGSPARPAERAAAKKLALAKVRTAPVPPREAVEKARAELALARQGQIRAGGEARGGSAADRRRQRHNLFNEFGGGERGYVVCPWTGLKMHWTDDPKENPRGYPLFERGKIFVKCQGGGYQLPNLIPESFAANRARNDRRLRKENSRGC